MQILDSDRTGFQIDVQIEIQTGITMSIRTQTTKPISVRIDTQH